MAGSVIQAIGTLWPEFEDGSKISIQFKVRNDPQSACTIINGFYGMVGYLGTGHRLGGSIDQDPPEADNFSQLSSAQAVALMYSGYD